MVPIHSEVNRLADPARGSSSPSRAFSPPAASGAETAGAATFHLIVPRSRALMGVWLTTPRRETAVEIAIEEQIAELVLLCYKLLNGIEIGPPAVS